MEDQRQESTLTGDAEYVADMLQEVAVLAQGSPEVSQSGQRFSPIEGRSPQKEGTYPQEGSSGVWRQAESGQTTAAGLQCRHD